MSWGPFINTQFCRHEHGWRCCEFLEIVQVLLKNTKQEQHKKQWFHKYKCWNTVLNFSHWLGRPLACNLSTPPFFLPFLLHLCWGKVIVCLGHGVSVQEVYKKGLTALFLFSLLSKLSQELRLSAGNPPRESSALLPLIYTLHSFVYATVDLQSHFQVTQLSTYQQTKQAY